MEEKKKQERKDERKERKNKKFRIKSEEKKSVVFNSIANWKLI